MKLPASKYIRIYSDIHLDFDIPTKKFKFDMLWTPEKLETDLETTLILAGDIWHADKPFSYFGQSWMQQLSDRFQYIIFILGNHDFWGGSLPREYDKTRQALEKQQLKNVFLLQNSQIEIGNHKFIGATLWTDFLMANPYCMNNAPDIMKDYKYIRYGNNFSRLSPKHILNEHMNSRNYIFEHAKKDFLEQKIWVVTHHLPSFQSIEGMYDREGLEFENALYYSSLDYLIKESEIDFWIHGHSHHAKDYMIGDTHIIANPRGYPGEDSMYNPWHLMELEG